MSQRPNIVHVSFMKAVFVFLLAVPVVFSGARTALADQNLVLNPSLETPNAAGTAPQGWSAGGFGTNNAVFNYPVAGYDDGNATTTVAAQIVIANYTDGDAKWYFDPVASDSDNYEFSDYYISDATTTLSAQLTDGNGTNTYVQLETLLPSADW